MYYLSRSSNRPQVDDSGWGRMSDGGAGRRAFIESVRSAFAPAVTHLAAEMQA